ncbi:hypothetical protein [Bacteroides caecimuris]|jgi:hypothetical protein|uniref:hypothetical protein n=1 Tax=Bacteroides caecimuris TaxID=1796613 RepID=UPI0025711E51|nr:hypothetical protein [Bacteroides caecimuris]
MMNKFISIRVAIIASLLMIVMWSCGGDGNEPDNPDRPDDIGNLSWTIDISAKSGTWLQTGDSYDMESIKIKVAGLSNGFYLSDLKFEVDDKVVAEKKYVEGMSMSLPVNQDWPHGKVMVALKGVFSNGKNSVTEKLTDLILYRFNERPVFSFGGTLNVSLLAIASSGEIFYDGVSRDSDDATNMEIGYCPWWLVSNGEVPDFLVELLLLPKIVNSNFQADFKVDCIRWGSPDAPGLDESESFKTSVTQDAFKDFSIQAFVVGVLSGTHEGIEISANFRVGYNIKQ